MSGGLTWRKESCEWGCGRGGRKGVGGVGRRSALEGLVRWKEDTGSGYRCSEVSRTVLPY